MMDFLLKRPIAVGMAFLAAVILGVITYFALPVSLLPSIAIPYITVRMTDDNASARELENTVVAPVRRSLMQLTGLTEMRSETRDGLGVLHLQFEYGTNTDLAYIEVNEKIDAAMNALPKSASRPKAVKASATDIPVLYLNMTLGNDRPYETTDDARFLDMCRLADQVVRRRIEQLPEVAMADVTGIPQECLRLVPDRGRMAMAGVTPEDLENALNSHNAEPAAMTVRNGYYEYSIRIANLLRTPEDVEQIYLRKGDRLMQLKDFCTVERVADHEQGYSLCEGRRAVTFAIIKQSQESVASMKRSLKEVTDYFAEQYPDIRFTVTQNQTELLDYTMGNLRQNLVLGLLLVCLVTLWLMGDARASVIIGASIVVAVVITFFVFYLFGVSLNVISLSGLILAVGMMIDNSLVITDNILQMRQRGLPLFESCARGTEEMIAPMLSSSLTTVAVFVPLVFMSGIAGAIFKDQAFSITAGLAVSYVVGIVLLPVMYLCFYRRDSGAAYGRLFALSRRSNAWMSGMYLRVVDRVFAHGKGVLTGALCLLPLGALLFGVLRKERMPAIDRDDTVAHIDWNENVNIDENARRIGLLMGPVDARCRQHTAYVGVQDYLLNTDHDLSSSEALLYLKTGSTQEVASLQADLAQAVRTAYPQATVDFEAPENLFEKIFASDEPDVVARLHRLTAGDGLSPIPAQLEERIAEATGADLEPTPLRSQLDIVPNHRNLLLYGVEESEVELTLRTVLKGNTVTTLRSFQQYLPIVVADTDDDLQEVMNSTMVQSKADDEGKTHEVPLRQLVTVSRSTDLKTITAGTDGEYIPLNFVHADHPQRVVDQVRGAVKADGEWDADFGGAYQKNRRMIGEVAVILLVAVLMMYFILCAQFESFVQPLIVLAEIPIDVTFALVTLWVTGHTLNLMSAIGIVVTCGIVVNDSILKIDSINTLRRGGMPLMEAIHTAGTRRLRAIVMTTLTTIFAMAPVLFTSDLGSELQQPLAVAMIGSMVVGTLVSMFFIPLVYYLIYQRHA